jgi:sulfate-transporting ATPase
MITGARTADTGEITIGPTVQLARRRPDARIAAERQDVWEAISGGQDILTVGKFEMPSRAYLGRFNFKGATSRRWSARCPAASAAGCTSPRRC